MLVAKTLLKVIFQFTSFLQHSVMKVKMRMQAQLGNRALVSGETQALLSKQKPYLN